MPFHSFVSAFRYILFITAIGIANCNFILPNGIRVWFKNGGSGERRGKIDETAGSTEQNAINLGQDAIVGSVRSLSASSFAASLPPLIWPVLKLIKERSRESVQLR